MKGVESSGVNNCKYLKPVEGKGLLKLKHCLQLASYMCRTNTCQDLRGQVHLGICIDQNQFIFLFSPLEHDRRRLPIFYQTPPFTWRNNLELKRESCLLLALAYLLHARRLILDTSNLKQFLSDQQVQLVTDTAKFVLQEPYTVAVPAEDWQPPSVGYLLKKYAELESKVETLTRQNASLMAALNERVVC